ncbi:MAG: hypothetical protein DA408_10330 [Bacteroidetes bacterium]|nr:MAG: hypothetical protein C7N36_20725 [Bacteroidota bacterium]PTM12566.1 MAG: hypothetical protein DA408_10330 [Bacteroidota bacterium]
MAILKNLKSLFVIEEEEPAKGKTAAPAGKTTPAPPVTSGPAHTKTTTTGKVTPKFTDILLGAMEKANLDGFDYLEYKKSLQSLQKMNMAEATAYQSAFAMAQTMGATPELLVQTAQHYLKVLQQEEAKFGSALANQQQSRIGSKREEQLQMQQAIKDKEAQIQQLQAEIAQHQEKLSKLDGEISDAVATIENTKVDFFASYQNLVGQIQADVEKMKQYLK